jgi:uncharacterized phage protein (TIGR01671 family)
MSREIKFRQWTGKSMNYNPKTGVGSGCAINDLGEPLMQFTGLKDSKGVDIYEGDIFKTGTGTLFTVKYEKYGFIGIGNQGDEYGVYTNQIYPVTKYVEENNPIIVIGNIYENPELIPTKQ